MPSNIYNPQPDWRQVKGTNRCNGETINNSPIFWNEIMWIHKCTKTRQNKTPPTQRHQILKRQKIVDIATLRHTKPDSVTINFYRQKNGVKEATITMHRSNGPLCPVTALRNITNRILQYQGCNLNSNINLVKYRSKIVPITSKITAEHIQNTVNLIWPEILGFDATDVGNHSVCSSFAMFLILNQVPPGIVQIQGQRAKLSWNTFVHRSQTSAMVLVN